MTTPFIKFSFTGGVFAPELIGRSDVEKYVDGVADANNFLIDYRGGIASRPGTEFVDQLPLTEIRLTAFSFNNDEDNNYLLVFTPERVYVVQDGVLLTEPAVSTDITDGTVSLTAHGLLDGDLVWVGNRTYLVGSSTTDTFDLLPVGGGEVVGVTQTAASVARVFYTSTTYPAEALRGLAFEKRRDFIFITHPDYPRKQLKRLAHVDWEFSDVATSIDIDAPTGRSAAASTSGTANLAWTVTALDADGNESPLSGISLLGSIVDYTTTAGTVTFQWNPVSGAVSYRVYRSIVYPTADQASKGDQLGFIGETRSTRLVDKNIIPDFTVNPPRYTDPFAAGAIDLVLVTANGSGYTTATVSASGGGTGFVAEAVITGGEVVSVEVLNPGSGYVNPVITIGGDGTGATATAEASPVDGNNPSAAAFWRQALWYLGTKNNPIGIFSSRAGSPYDFVLTNVGSPSEPQRLTIDSGDLTPIRYAGVLNDMLLVFMGSAVWKIELTESGYQTSKHSANGVSNVPPLFINREALYVLENGEAVWSIGPPTQANVSSAIVDIDRSLYSSHLVSFVDPIIAWDFSRNPDRIVWAVLESGRLLSLTYVSEQNVYGWAPHDTQGYVRDVTVVLENGSSRLYLAVERENGLFIERMASRRFESLEDIWGVDCALQSLQTYPEAGVVFDPSSNILTADADVFDEDDVGSHVRFWGGRFSVVQFISATQLLLTPDIDLKRFVPQNFRTPRIAEGDWSLDPKVDGVQGLWHLEGRRVQVYADGREREDTIVQGGTIVLSFPSSKVLVGLGYDGFFKTLPVVAGDSVIEHRQKRAIVAHLRLLNSRGVEVGHTLDTNYNVAKRTVERVQEPTRLASGLFSQVLYADWDKDGSIVVRKEGPLSVSVLGIILEMEMGDDEG